MERRSTLFLAAAVLALASPCLARDLYRSNLEAVPDGSGSVPGLKLDSGQFTVRDGWLEVRSDRSNPVIRLDATAVGDCTFRATVRGAQNCHWAGLVARGAYRLEINRQFVHLALLRLVGDEWRVVAKTPGPLEHARNTQQFEMRLVIQGNRVMGFLDDKQLIDFTDPDPVSPGGEFSLVSGWGTRLAWQGISLSDEPDLTQWRMDRLPKRCDPGLIEVTRVRGNAPDNVYFDNEFPNFTVTVRNPSDQKRDLALRWRVIDVRGHEVARGDQSVSLAPGAFRDLDLLAAVSARGCFKVALDAGPSARNVAWVEDIGSFTVVSRELYDRPRHPDSIFGGHMDGINLEWHLQAGRKIGIQWARCHNMMQWTWWTRIQPNGPEDWIWGDEAQALVDRLGFGTLGQFLYVPEWASSAPPDDTGRRIASPPKDWEQFARYVRETVSHYKGSIHVWEVWNEPHYSGFWRGTPQEYAKLIEIAHREAKAADPACIILGGGGVHPRSMDWTRAMLEAGGGRFMDGFSIHYLEPDYAREIMPRICALLREYGVTGPIWNSEESVASTSFLDQLRVDYLDSDARYHYRNACYELVRTYMENLANGIDRIFYYDQADPWRFKPFDKPRTEGIRPVNNGMWDEGRMYKPIAAAHAALALVIEGKRYVSRLDRDAMRVFFFEGEKSAAAVQYAEYSRHDDLTALALDVPEGLAGRLTVVDFMGNETPVESVGETLLLPLSREPVYLVCRGESAREALETIYGAARAGEPGGDAPVAGN
ncbi:MAG: hypothetical protein KBI47_07990 [Armatimonadetes bacterium]|nr:hypothetical protein [Armatimonadota bacterium]